MNTLELIGEKYNLDLNEPIVKIPNLDSTGLAKLFNELSFKTGAEIGVLRGWNSHRLCQNIPGLKLLCVDPWRRYSGHRRGRSTPHQELDMQNAIKILANFDATIIRKLSMDAIKDVPDRSLDFVYIDGHHVFDYVMEDIIEWSKKVRVGGAVSGHDYFISDKPNRNGVVEAVDAYVLAHRINNLFLTDIETGTPSWMFIKNE